MRNPNKPVGWRREPVRHGLAAKGISTTTTKAGAMSKVPAKKRKSHHTMLMDANDYYEGDANIIDEYISEAQVAFEKGDFKEANRLVEKIETVISETDWGVVENLKDKLESRLENMEDRNQENTQRYEQIEEQRDILDDALNELQDFTSIEEAPKGKNKADWEDYFSAIEDKIEQLRSINSDLSGADLTEL